MAEDYKRHDISVRTWELLQPYLPGRRGSLGRNAGDNRQFINAVYGYYKLEYTGEIYRQNMEIGKIPIDVFVDGEIEEYGKNYSTCLFETMTLNG